MSPEAKMPDLAPLAEALLLADVDDPASLAVLRELLQALTPWPIAEQASVADPALAECLAILDETWEGEGSAPLGRLSTALTPVMGLVTSVPQEPPKPAGAAGAAPATRRGAPAEPRSGAGARAVTRGGDKTPEAGPAPAAPAVTPAPGSLAGDPELVRDFAVSAREHLEQADGLLMSLEAVPDDAESVNSVFRAFHTIKGMAGFLDFTRIQDTAHEAESVLDGVRKGSDPLDQETIDTLFAAVDTLRSLVDEMAGAAVGAADAVAAEAAESPRGTAAPAARRGGPPAGQAAAARSHPVTRRPATPAAGPAPAATAKDQPVARAAGGGLAGGTVHVSGERLDRLCDTIGELVIAKANVVQAVHGAGAWDEGLEYALSQLDKISRLLQEMSTSMRMVSLGTTMRRMKRLVRDLAHELGKNVQCELEGEDIELDKHIVDSIGDPLIHLVRNAVDHGIERDEAERVQAGKRPLATVRISARHTGGRIVVEVTDDGRGIDGEALLRRAREVGVVAPDERPPADEVPALIFAPGLSTASSVTGLSGRGVGMDVVKRSVDALLGSVSVNSKPGEGTTIRLTLPLTLAIIDGMLVRVGDERYVIPSLSIVRSQRLERRDITKVVGQAEMMATPQGLVPLVRLRQILDGGGNGGNDNGHDEDGLVTVVADADGLSLTGIVVTELIGQQQVVIKAVGAGLGETPGVSGAAILPDGCVGLILDVQGVVRLAHKKESWTRTAGQGGRT